MKKISYVLVADGGRAKILQSDGHLKDFAVIYEQVNFRGRQSRSDIDSDRAGMQHSGGGGFHSYAGDNDSHRHETEEFARELCKILQTARQAGKFDSLIIAAPPHFLGNLRQHLSQDCQNCLVKSLDKDLVQASVAELAEHLA
ncbi:MAG: host attachment protein [Pseudomonadales bacterium]|nr:host attachment protein [Pseudomonadales bacterium]